MAAVDAGRVAWWREPTKDQWYAWWAAWLGWTLDAFDFTVFLLIIKPIADEFQVPTTEVAIVFTLTLWMRLVGAVASGWLADRIGRKTPLMISIFWYSICNFIAGFSPTFWFLLVFRTLLGIGMGAEWPAGAALAMETWPIRSRGFMSGVLQGSWSIGFLLSSVLYGCCGSACCRPCRSCGSAITSRSRRSGWRTAASSVSKTARSGLR
jgi:MFS transporter, SHS family, lactate transporter